MREPLLYYRNNIVSLLNLIDLMNKRQNKQILYSPLVLCLWTAIQEISPILRLLACKSPSPYGKSNKWRRIFLSDSVVAFPELKSAHQDISIQ